MVRKFPLETSTAFSNLLVRIVYRFNILLGGCGICIDLKFSEAISRICVLYQRGKEARGSWWWPHVGQQAEWQIGQGIVYLPATW